MDGCGLEKDGWMDRCGFGNGWVDVVWRMDGWMWFRE